MKYEHRFEVNAPLEAVADFHAQSASMAKITPPPVVDNIELTLRPHPLWGLIGLGMWLSLPLLFAYRGWKTRRLLEARTARRK